MSDVKFIEIKHNNARQTFGVYAGIPVTELKNLIRAVFPSTKRKLVVGIVTEDGKHLSLAQFCRQPQACGVSNCVELLIQDELPVDESRVQSIGSADDFVDELANAGYRVVIVEFYTMWCDACQQIMPEFDQLSLLLPEAVFLRINAEELREVAREMKVSAVPTFQFFLLGQNIGELVGPSKDELRDFISYAVSMDLQAEPAPAEDDAAAAAPFSDYSYSPILSLISKLAESPDPLISNLEKYILQDLVLAADPYILRAYDTYLVEQNLRELVNGIVVRVNEVAVRGKIVAPARQTEVNQSNSIDTNQLAYQEILMSLYDKHILTTEQAQALCKLVEQENPLVSACFSAYQYDFDELELVDTLFMILDKDQQKEQLESVDNSTLTDGELIEILQHLGSESEFTIEDITKLSDLVFHKEDARVLAAINTYAHDSDWRKLVNTLSTIVDMESVDSTSSEAEDQLGDRVASPISVDPDYSDLITAMLANGSISREEAKLLSYLIQSGDDVVLAAFDLYAEEDDWTELQDTLIRVIRSRWEDDRIVPPRPEEPEPRAIDLEQESSDSEEPDFTGQELAFVSLLKKQGLLERSDADLLTELILANDVVVTAAFDLYRADENWSELHDTLSRTLRRRVMREKCNVLSVNLPLYRDVFENTVYNLLEDGSISLGQADLLKRMFNDEDEVIVAAFEAYQLEQDESELRESLFLIATHNIHE